MIGMTRFPGADGRGAPFPREWNVLFAASVPASLLVYGLFLARGDVPALAEGLLRITTSTASLLTDYAALAGPAPALVNAGLTGLIAFGLCALLGATPTGPLMAGIFTVTGFGLFGKNILNVWPVLLGIRIYCWSRGIPLRDVLVIALFGTALAPVGSELAFGLPLPGWTPLARLGLGLLGGGTAGFFLPPLAKHLLSAHQGYNLYNVGFTCGFCGTLILALLRALGIPLMGNFAWSTDSTRFFAFPLAGLFGTMILAGFLVEPDPRGGLGEIYRSRGRLVSDFVRFGGLGPSLINMGSLGFMGMGYALLVGGILNGPVVGAILTLVGFGGFGVHPRNACFPMMGGWLAAHLSIWNPDDPGPLLAALFGTTLAPVSGTFGPVAGCLAGVLNLCLSMGLMEIHGGLNLYNNGFSGGITAMLMLPILESFRDE